MQPVPSYQLIPFLDWLYQQGYSGRRTRSTRLEHLALEFLQSGGLTGIAQIMFLFQTCPVLGEPTLEEQMEHFSSCGRCREMLRDEEFRGHTSGRLVRAGESRENLHPLLSGFVDRMTGTSLDRASDWTDRQDIQIPHPQSFEQAILEIGPELRQRFLEYLAEMRSINPGLIEEYQSWRSGSSRELSPRFNTEVGEGESLHFTAQRLSASAQIATEDGFYDEQIAEDPHFAHLVMAIGDGSANNAAQILEFLSWLRHQAPKLSLPGNIPREELEGLAQRFCESRGYTNGSTFAKEAQSWLSGAGPASITRRISRFLGMDKRRNKESAASRNPLDRYGAIRFHGLFMFLSSGDFPKFINEHWRDLHYLTGDDIDIYYSQGDLTQRASGYEIANHFRSLQLRVDALPALLLWEDRIEDGRPLSLRDLNHTNIVEVMKTVVQAIRDGHTLEDVTEHGTIRATELSHSRTQLAIGEHHGMLIVSDGGAVTHETHNITGSTVGAVGSHAVAHDNVFFQDARKSLSDSELKPSDSPIISQLAKLIASRDIEGIELSERMEGAYHLASLADAAAQGQAQDKPLAGWKKWIASLGNRGSRVLTLLAGTATIAAPIARLLGVPV